MTKNLGSPVDILGILVVPLGPDSLLEKLFAYCRTDDKTRVVLYANPHNLLISLKDKELRNAFAKAELVHVDGMGVMWAARLLRHRGSGRANAHRFFTQLANWFQQNHIPLFLLGTHLESVETAAKVIQHDWPDLLLAGYYHGYFDEAESAAVVNRINASGAQVLLVGMGSPRQEKWAYRYCDHLHVRLILSVGALFDFLSGREQLCPRWTHRLGLEWIFRLLHDPRGKWRRYLSGNISFGLKVIGQWVGNSVEGWCHTSRKRN